MRGRTNISGGITLNANTDEFVVATGNTIAGGDFCEYTYNNEVVSLGSTFRKGAYIVNLQSDLYIGLIASYPTLFEYKNGVITIISNYSTATNILTQLDNTHYATWKDDKLTVLTISGTTITATAEITVRLGSVLAVTNKILVGKAIDDVKSYIINDAYTTITEVSSINANVGDVISTSTNRAVFHKSSVSNNTYTHTFTTYSVSSTGALTYYSTTTTETYNNFYYLDYNEKLINDRYILTIFPVRKGSSSYTYAIDACCIDIQDRRSVFTEIYNGERSALMSPVNGSNKFVVCVLPSTQSQGNYCLICTFNPTTLSFTVSNTYTDTLENPSNLWKFTDYLFGIMKQNVGYKNISIESGEIAVGTPANTVKQWQGAGNPLGVAKSSGSAGDTIEVYIPQVSS